MQVSGQLSPLVQHALSLNEGELLPSYSLSMAQPINVHLVGRLPFASVEEVLARASRTLPDRLHSMPDGEIGPRQSFVAWQSSVFPLGVLNHIHRKGQPRDRTGFLCSIDDIKHTGYDAMAIESYQTFRKLQDLGIIPPIRFQVSISTPVNALKSHVDSAYLERVEPLHLERLTRDLRHLQDTIPAQDLAIQIDAAVEFAYLEYERGRIQNFFFQPHFSPVI